MPTPPSDTGVVLMGTSSFIYVGRRVCSFSFFSLPSQFRLVGKKSPAHQFPALAPADTQRFLFEKRPTAEARPERAVSETRRCGIEQTVSTLAQFHKIKHAPKYTTVLVHDIDTYAKPLPNDKAKVSPPPTHPSLTPSFDADPLSTPVPPPWNAPSRPIESAPAVRLRARVCNT